MARSDVPKSGAGRGAAVESPAEQIVTTYHRKRVSRHPYFVRLASRPGDLAAVWLLMANLREGISKHFVRWLARTIERVEDRRVGSLLATQLTDELGRGDFLQIHSLLLDQFVEALARWRFPGPDSSLLSAGRRLADSAAKPFYAEHPYQAVGALVVGEIFAEKMDVVLAREMRRQDQLTGAPLTWLDIHEKLEANHAKDSGELAALIPNDSAVVAAAWRGADEQWQTLWRFLDEVHTIELAAAARPRTTPTPRSRSRPDRDNVVR